MGWRSSSDRIRRYWTRGWCAPEVQKESDADEVPNNAAELICCKPPEQEQTSSSNLILVAYRVLRARAILVTSNTCYAYPSAHAATAQSFVRTSRGVFTDHKLSPILSSPSLGVSGWSDLFQKKTSLTSDTSHHTHHQMKKIKIIYLKLLLPSNNNGMWATCININMMYILINCWSTLHRYTAAAVLTAVYIFPWWIWFFTTYIYMLLAVDFLYIVWGRGTWKVLDIYGTAVRRLRAELYSV